MNSKKHYWFFFITLLSLIIASLACGSQATQQIEKTAVSTQPEVQQQETMIEEKPTEPEVTSTSAPPTPTSTPITPTPTPIPPTPTQAPIGLSRANPYPLTELVNAPNWDIQIRETVRGDEAWQLIKAANQFNDPAPEGMEYLLVKIYAKCTYADSDSHSIGANDFEVTGDKRIRYSQASVVEPKPGLDAELFAEGETEGWVAFSVGVDEENLILIVDELMSFDEDSLRYIALEEGAAVSVDMELANIQPTELGISRQNTIPIGETGITDDWAITIQEVIRGDEAWAMAQEANKFNDPPEPGMEYVALKVHAQYISTIDEVASLDGYYFHTTGDNNILYDNPSIVDPAPALEAYLYPGGEYEGWVMVQVAAGETNIMAKFEPIFSFSEKNTRYFALVDNASISVPQEVGTIKPNEVGVEKGNPASFGETVITDDWEINLVDVIRGNEAWTMIQEANQFNDPPEPGMEYILIQVHVKSINPEDDASNFDEFGFEITGDANVVYENPSLVEPNPKLDVNLYPTGEYEGWMSLQAAEGETGLVLIYDPGFLGEKRFFSIEK